MLLEGSTEREAEIKFSTDPGGGINNCGKTELTGWRVGLVVRRFSSSLF
jgi:hypothetical protein